jgi:hypothetical protein
MDSVMTAPSDFDQSSAPERWGICTLGNDYVLDQVIALLNSIRATMGADFPVCIFPYDNQLEQLQAAIADRPNVTLFNDAAAIAEWENQAKRIWDVHPTATQSWPPMDDGMYYRMGMHRRFVAFSAPFDRFIYMDADTLLLSDATPVFERLDDHDWVVYDFQHRDPSHVYNVDSSQFAELFAPEILERKMFCAGFYAAKRGVLSAAQLDWMVTELAQGDADILYPRAPDQTIVNYWVMKANLSVYNFAFALPPEQVVGCCVTSPHFELRDDQLYDRGNPLLYLHYIGLPADFCLSLPGNLPALPLFACAGATAPIHRCPDRSQSATDDRPAPRPQTQTATTCILIPIHPRFTGANSHDPWHLYHCK